MTKKNAYDDTLAAMYGLRRFGIKLGLSTTRNILKELGDPHTRFSTIHVAGTNGKGSIASCIASILRGAGYKTGLYTSPHLVKFNERILVDGRQIPDGHVVQAFEAVRKASVGMREATFFEYATAMALFEFQRQNVEWAVMETGMGGRLDATNVIEPELSIVSNISVEHRDYLGHTIALIAGEKGGIIKPGVPVVTGAKQKAAIEVLEKIAKEKSSPLFRMGKDFRVKRSKDGGFSYYGMDQTWKNMSTPLPGSHQIENAAIALAACEILKRKKVGLSDETIRAGVAENSWPGRLEVVSSSPFTLLDGAHNLMGARALGKFMANHLEKEKTTLVIGILDDKPYAAMLKSLVPHCARVILTMPETERALPPETLLKEAEKMSDHVSIIPSVKEAVIQAIDQAKPDETVCIAGSLYVVGEAKQALSQLKGDGAQG